MKPAIWGWRMNNGCIPGRLWRGFWMLLWHGFRMLL